MEVLLFIKHLRLKGGNYYQVWMPLLIQYTGEQNQQIKLSVLPNVPKSTYYRIIDYGISVFSNYVKNLKIEKNRNAIYFLSKESEIAPVIKKTKAPTKQKSIESTSETIKEIIEYLNQCAGTVFKPSSKIAVTNINLRLKEGYSLDDFKKVIYIKSNKWLNTDYAQHLNPKTLFGDKFENYVNENLTTPKTKQQKNIENVTKATELGWNT